jgi:uncharacterized membrane protein YeaQ/YmgE (transglycosylase-associated protein family)
MGIIAMIIVGLIAGLIAKAIMPGKDPGGVIITILLGIVGSILGGRLIAPMLGYGRATDAGDISSPGFLMSIVLAVIGAIILLAVYRLIKGKSMRTGV